MKKSAAKAYRLRVKAYDGATLNKRSCCEWFQKFKNAEFAIEDKKHSEKLNVYEDKKLEVLFEKYSRQTQEKLAVTLDVTQQAI